MTPRFIALSTGRAGSRYLAGLLNRAGVKTHHEKNTDFRPWIGEGALGEVTAWLVTRMDACPDAAVWHFTRHPQPFVTSLINFGFWKMDHFLIHPYTRRTGNLLLDSFRFWIDWNRRILDVCEYRHFVRFRIEDVSDESISVLAASVGVKTNGNVLEAKWEEKQSFSPIPQEVQSELLPMMAALGYA